MLSHTEAFMPSHTLASSDTATAFLDLDLRIVRVNESFAARCGLPLAEHRGRALADVLPALAEPLHTLAQHALERGEALSEVVQTADGNGSATLERVRFTCWPVRSRVGVVLGVDVQIQPLNETLPMHTQLDLKLANADLFAAIMEHVPVGIVVLSGADLRVRWANAIYCQFLDEPYRSQGISGLCLQTFIPQAEERGIADVFRRVAATGEPYVDPELAYDGFTRGVTYWRWSLLPLPLSTSSVPDLILVVTEVTDSVVARQQAERLAAQLAAEQRQLATVLRQLPAGVVIGDAATGRLLTGNAAVEHIFGFPFKSSSGIADYSDDWQLFRMDGTPYPPDELPMARALRDGETVAGAEMMFRRSDGTLGTIIVNAAPIHDSAGNVTAGVVTFLDISDRVAAERALRDSEQHLRNVLDSLSVFVGVLTPDGTLVQANEAALQAASLRPEDVLGKPFEDTYWWAYDPSVQARLRAAIQRAAGGEASRYDVVVRLADEQFIIIDFMLAPMFDAQGAVHHLIPSGIDITERVATERALQASEARLRLALIAGQMGTWEYDTATQYVRRSESTDTLFGLPASGTPRHIEELLARVHPDDRARVADAIAHSVNHGDEHAVEYRVTLPDGQTRWLSSRGEVIYSDQGQPVLLRGALVDVTERRNSEERLRFLTEASKLLASSLDIEQTLVNLTNLIVPQLADWCIIDLRTSEGTLDHVEVAHTDRERAAQVKAMYQRHPPPIDAPHGSPRVLRTGRAELLSDVLENWLEETARDAEELEFFRTIGRHSAMMVPLLVRDQTLGTMTFVADQSRRKYAEGDLELAEAIARRATAAIENAQLYRAAQEAVRVRDAFLSIAAHELRTPLTALLGQAQLLKRRMERTATTTDRDLRSINVVAEQARRLNQLIMALLDISRLEQGQFSITFSTIDVTEVTRHVVEETRAMLDQHTLVYEAPTQPLLISGDALRLEQVMQNLLQNAIKYSPDGGSIHVRVAQVGTYASIEVSDEGVGIPPSSLQQLFHRFYRGDNPMIQHIKGFGVGLYVVREIVTRHGGSVSVASEEGQGSTFTVLLPLAQAGEAAGQPTA